jgi:limonene-1,2-epoxide hydrolase
VTTFIKANEAKDLDAIVSFLTDDCTYENVPMTAVTGPDGVRATLEPFYTGAGQIEWRVLRQVAEGNTVMNERIDRFELGGKWLEIRVAGVFEVRDGKISLWRDYFDLAQFTSQMQ